MISESITISGGETVLFWVLGPLMVLASLVLLFGRKAVHTAIAVMFVMVGMAVLYITLEAPFLGVVQIVVYTGAVMMLFVFVLMLVGVDASDSRIETLRGQRWIGVIMALGLGAVLAGVILRASFSDPIGLKDANAIGNPKALSEVLFSDFVFPMEVVGVLLVTAALAALVLTHRQRLARKIAQPETADAKVAALAEGGRIVNLPAPGVYARNNAMDTPALDPAGQPIVESVSRILRIRGQERSATQIVEAERDILTLHEPELVQEMESVAEELSPAMGERSGDSALVEDADQTGDVAGEEN